MLRTKQKRTEQAADLWLQSQIGEEERFGDLMRRMARVKQTAPCRRRYVAMPSSSSSTADTPPAGASSEDTLSNVAAEELHPGDTLEFGEIGRAHV